MSHSLRTSSSSSKEDSNLAAAVMVPDFSTEEKANGQRDASPYLPMANPSSTIASQERLSGAVQPSTRRIRPIYNENASVAAAILFHAIFLSFVGIAVYLTLARTPPAREADETPYERGQESLLRMLWLAGDPNIDPCSDFLTYTCYNYHPERTPGAVYNMWRDYVRVIGKVSRNDVGKLLFAYYRSCISTLRAYEESWRAAVRAVLEVTAVGHHMSSLHLFSTIVRLNLAYSIHGNVVIYQAPYGAVPTYRVRQLSQTFLQTLRREGALCVIAPPQDPFLEASLDPVQQDMLDLGLAEIQGSLEVNVTIWELRLIAAELEQASSVDYLLSEAAFLADAVPGVSTRVWADLVESCTGMTMKRRVLHSPTVSLRHQFSLLLDSARQPATTVLVIVEAALSLLQELSMTEPQGPQLHEFCFQRAFELNIVWELGELLSFSAKTEHNEVILNTFDVLMGAVRAELEDIFDAEDAELAKRVMENITLVLPYHLIPLDTKVPNFGANYYHNLLLAREHRITHVHFMGLPEISLQTEENRAFFVTLPTWLYAAVMVNRTSTLLTNAVFGFYLADKIWSVIFERDWGNASISAIDRYTRSSRDIDSEQVDISAIFISRPHVALRSCVRALKLPRWHEQVLYGGASPMSWSQAFYGLVAFNFFCDVFLYTYPDPMLQERVHNMTQENQDFLDAFKCARNIS